MKTAAIFGATGLVGSLLLRELLCEPGYRKVIAFVRRDPGIRHPKLVLAIGDFDTLAVSNEPIDVDDLFLTLGTNKQQTPDQKAYYRIDHDYPVLAAKRAKQGGAQSVFLLSALGANPSSSTFYFRTKGETERDLAALGYRQTRIFRPSIIVGARKHYGPFEKTLATVWGAFNPLMLGQFDKYRAIAAEDIAKAMVASAALPDDATGIYLWREMNALVHHAQRSAAAR